MKGYSKIKIIHSPSHSRSMDHLDLLNSLEHHIESSNTETAAAASSPPSKLQETNGQKSKNHLYHPKNATETANLLKNQDCSFLGPQEDQESNDNDNEEMPRKLKNSSVSSTYALDSLKKAFSIRRSCSVSERYCRIHDQYSNVPSPTHHHHLDGDGDSGDDGDGDCDGFMNKSRSTRRRHRIFKACKKIIGL